MITGFDAADEVSRRHWRRFGRGFQGAEAFRRAVRSELMSRTGLEPVRATYDHAGNCAVCGEAGRCPGWHTEEEVRGRSVGNPGRKTTPGPWRPTPRKGRGIVQMGSEDGRSFANIVGSFPHLLKALEDILETAEDAQGEWLPVELAHCPEWVGTYRDIANMAADAISKARKVRMP